MQGHCPNHRVKSSKPLSLQCVLIKPVHLYLDMHLLTSIGACQGRIDSRDLEQNKPILRAWCSPLKMVPLFLIETSQGSSDHNMKNRKERIYLGQGLTLLFRLSQPCQAFLFNPGSNWSRLHNAFPSPENQRWDPGEQEGRKLLSEFRKCKCVYCLWLQLLLHIQQDRLCFYHKLWRYIKPKEREWSMKHAAVRKDFSKLMGNV